MWKHKNFINLQLYAAFDGSISLTNPSGAILKTQGKYCDKDITITPVLEEKTVTPSTTQQSVEPSNGNVGLKKVTVGAIQIETKTATPSASAQTITPTSGKYLASVTVSAVPSESKTVTPTKSVQTVTPSSGKWLSSVTVNAIPDNYIIPSGTQQIAENGTYDVTDKASVVVDVPSTGGVEEVATSSAMDALLVEANVGKCYKFTGTTDTSYTNGDLYLVEGGAVTTETWLLKSNLTFAAESWSYDVNFTSNGSSYSKFSYNFTSPLAAYLTYDTTNVYETNTGWVNSAYRTIVFDEPVTDTTLLSWLTANGTKQ